MALNPNAKKLVAALRSGEFRQAQGVLERYRHNGEEGDVGFCCLGVACFLAAQEGIVKRKPQEFGRDVNYVQYDDEGEVVCTSEVYLPPAVQEWLGFRDERGGFRAVSSPNDDPEANTLAWLNDQRYTFEQIADVIESEPDGLFAEHRRRDA